MSKPQSSPISTKASNHDGPDKGEAREHDRQEQVQRQGRRLQRVARHLTNKNASERCLQTREHGACNLVSPAHTAVRSAGRPGRRTTRLHEKQNNSLRSERCMEQEQPWEHSIKAGAMAIELAHR